MFAHIAIVRAAVATAPNAAGVMVPVFSYPPVPIAIGHAILAALFIFSAAAGSGGHIVNTISIGKTHHPVWLAVTLLAKSNTTSCKAYSHTQLVRARVCVFVCVRASPHPATAVTGHTAYIRCIMYVIVQTLGAIVGAFLLRVAVGWDTVTGGPSIAECTLGSLTEGGAFVSEFMWVRVQSS